MKKQRILDILSKREQGKCQLYPDREIFELERMLWDTDNYKECWLCNHFMNYEEFVDTNIKKIPEDQLQSMWDSSLVGLMCCTCNNLITHMGRKKFEQLFTIVDIARDVLESQEKEILLEGIVTIDQILQQNPDVAQIKHYRTRDYANSDPVSCNSGCLMLYYSITEGLKIRKRFEISGKKQEVAFDALDAFFLQAIVKQLPQFARKLYLFAYVLPFKKPRLEK